MKWEQEDPDFFAIPESLPEGFYKDLRREPIVVRGQRFFSKLISRDKSPRTPAAPVITIEELRVIRAEREEKERRQGS